MKQDARVSIDLDVFHSVERLATYEVANAVLEAQLRIQQHFGLRAEECQVLMVIVLATVQRYVRQSGADRAYFDDTPLPEQERGAISRRRISEVLGVPFETVRRHVDTLLGRGMIVERSRGKLSTPGGTLSAASRADLPVGVAQIFISVVNALLRIGAAHQKV